MRGSDTPREGWGRIYRAQEGFLRCLAAPPRPHDALPGAAARDCGHLGEPTPRGPVAFPLPAAALPDARPRPLHMSPEQPPRGEMLCERECSLPLRLPLHGGCGRSAGPHLHVHTTYAPKIRRLKNPNCHERVLGRSAFGKVPPTPTSGRWPQQVSSESIGLRLEF